MFANKEEFSISRMAKVLNVSESGYYKWVIRMNTAPGKREKENTELKELIYGIFQHSRGSFGSRKVTHKLNAIWKRPVNHKRVERIMRENYLFSKVSKKYVVTTDSNHDNMIAENLIARAFDAQAPSEKMVSDTTVVQTKEGNLYVAGIIDLYGRMPVGLAMSIHNDKYLVIEALEDMILRGCGKEGCIMHSDQGATYTSADYRKRLSKYGFLCSMSHKGDCWDNAPMECFWGKMKSEWLKTNYTTRQEAARDINEYVWSFYPYERPHEANGYLTPVEIYRRV